MSSWPSTWAAPCSSTNILRDLDEDAAMGRLYLPAEALARPGSTAATRAVVADPRIDAACRWVAAKAREHYAAAGAVLKARPAGASARRG